MADNEAVPPEILDFFRQLRDLVDQTVQRLELASPSGRDTADLFAHAGVATVEVQALSPTVMVTAEQVEAAKSWLAESKGKLTAAVGVGVAAWKGAEIVALLEGLIAFAERLLGIADS